jgi:hypothetical protein
MHEAFDIAVGQLTPDNHRDVAITTGEADVAVFPGNGTGALADPVYSPVAGDSAKLAVGDLDGNGQDDLAVTTTGKVSVLLRQGTFARNVDYDAGDGAGIAIGDLDGDGRTDLVAGNAVLPGLATAGTFGAPKAFAGVVEDVQIGDLNADGKPDLVTGALVARLDDGRTVKLNSTPAAGVVIADTNRDGRPDVLAADGTGLATYINTTARSKAQAAATTDRRALPVAFTADPASQVRLYVKAPGATAFALAGEQTGTSGEFDYRADRDGAYAFYTTVVDEDGNEETAPATPDATTQVALRRSLKADSPSFGTLTVGTIFDAFARVTNDGEATLDLQAPQLQSSDFAIVADQCAGTTLAPGDGCDLLVRFSPTAGGTRSASALFADGALELAGEGFAPPVVLPSPPPPPPPPAPQKIAATLGVAVRSTGKTRTRIRALVVKGIPDGATVVAKLGKKTVTKRNLTGGRLSLKTLIAKPIKVPAKLTVTITKAGMVKQVLTLTTRARKNPRVTTS